MYANVPYISKCLSDIRALRKLVLYLGTEYPDRPRRCSQPESYFSQLIARNPDLTHLAVLIYASPIDLSKLLCDIPSDRPLKLEHVSIDDRSSNLESIVPHIPPLRSLEIRSRMGVYTRCSWYSVLSRENMFPPTLTFKALPLNPQLVAYLNSHPGIVSLSVDHEKYIAKWNSAISQVISQHAEKLEYLAVHGYALSVLLRNVQNELHLLRCSALREITLMIPLGKQRFGINDASCSFIEIPFLACLFFFFFFWQKSRIFPVLARLGHSLTVAIRCDGTQKFKECVEYCRAAKNPLTRSLAGRIVYEKYTTDPLA